MSAHSTQAKEPLLRMVRRDTISSRKSWGIRAAAFLLSLVTGAIVILLLGHLCIYFHGKRRVGISDSHL